MQVKWFEILKRVTLFSSLLFLSGCAQRELHAEKSAMIVWKSPAFRYADMGFVSDNGSRLQVEIYGSGTALMRLKVDKDSICMSRFSCMTKERFNRELLCASYPGDTLENIFRGKPLFGGKSLLKKRNGFTQTIQKSHTYHIVYTVSTNQIIFRDTINQIVIKVIKQ
ncbi:MAG TPA: hypothetical protein ENK71_01925 [Epsilonproteobacteria bacterium]|nr:hypothetical protein [Campylobacterota bacterium]